MTEITIQKVENNTALAQALIRFVEDFSWEEVKAHTLHTLRNWEFSGWEAVFAATDGGTVIGMVTLLQTDYYPLPEIYPWISTLFVTESHRGRRIGQMLIDHASEYAKALGFAQTYIPSVHTGLYEKYGYRYLRDIVNYGGETDRLYVRETE